MTVSDNRILCEKITFLSLETTNNNVFYFIMIDYILMYASRIPKCQKFGQNVLQSFAVNSAMVKTRTEIRKLSGMRRKYIIRKRAAQVITYEVITYESVE